MNKIIKIITVSIFGMALVGGGIYYAFKNDLFFSNNNREAASTENSDKNSGTEDLNNWTIECTSTSKSTVESGFTGYNIAVQVSEIPEEETSYSILNESDRRAFSISEFEDVDTNEPTYTAFVDVSTDDYRSETGIDASFQLCNDENKTNHILEIGIGPENERAGVTSYLHGGQSYIPTKPGNYRFDGYVYLDGGWHLVGQIDLVFTE